MHLNYTNNYLWNYEYFLGLHESLKNGKNLKINNFNDFFANLTLVLLSSIDLCRNSDKNTSCYKIYSKAIKHLKFCYFLHPVQEKMKLTILRVFFFLSWNVREYLRHSLPEFSYFGGFKAERALIISYYPLNSLISIERPSESRFNISYPKIKVNFFKTKN